MKHHLFGLIQQVKQKLSLIVMADGLGLRSWFTHNLSEDIYSFIDVSATRLPKLDDLENADPKAVIKILVKEYGWESDEINIENIDELDELLS